MADYGSLATYLENAKKEATFADLTCNGWDLVDDNTVRRVENYGESSTTWIIHFDGSTSGSSYNIGAETDSPAAAAQAKEVYDEYFAKWDQQLDELVRGWDSLPEDDHLQGLMETVGAATKKVAGGTGNSNSTFGNPDLSDIGAIRQTLSGQSGNTIYQFNVFYGPDRIEQVLDAHCEAVACLGLALAGQQEVWTKLREDVAVVMEASAEHFKQTRQRASTTFSTALTVVKATLDLVGVFSFAAPGVNTAISAASAGAGFLSTAMAALPEDTEAKGEYSGQSPDDVYDGLKDAFTELDRQAGIREEGLDDMLQSMIDAAGLEANRANFHIHPAKGLAPEFADSDDIVDMSFPAMESIGYSSMPKIGNAFFQCADIARDANNSGKWYRPYAPVPGNNIGTSSVGPYYSWEQLLYAIIPLMNDTGAEIVRAGEDLARAAGYLRDSDEWARQALGENYRDLQDGTNGWRDPYTEPTPPPTPRGGPQPI